MLLDVLRFSAALAVVFGHFTHPDFSIGWPYRLDLALDGVGVFFVLSGFVIRLITTLRPVTARDYAIDRASRIYSVALPAVVFTLLVAAALHRLGSWPGALVDIVTNLTFTAQCWGLDVPVLSNSVFWSLCYECFYYAIYGIAFFGRGRARIFSLAAIILLAGPPILSMLPLWLLGCVSHDVYQRLRSQPHRNALRLLLACVPIFAALLLVWRYLPAMQRAFAPAYLAVHQTTHAFHLHLLMRAGPRFYWVGVPLAILLPVALLLLERAPLAPAARTVRVVRFVADGTFALYLLHIPLLWLAAAWIPYNHAALLQQAAICSGIIVLCILAQRPMERLKRAMRSMAPTRRLSAAAFQTTAAVTPKEEARGI